MTVVCRALLSQVWVTSGPRTVGVAVGSPEAWSGGPRMLLGGGVVELVFRVSRRAVEQQGREAGGRRRARPRTASLLSR